MPTCSAEPAAPGATALPGSRARSRSPRRHLRPRLSRALVGGLTGAVLAACSAGAPPAPAPAAVPALTGVTSFPGLSHDHQAADQTYPQVPPVGGPHWPPQSTTGYGWLRCGVYTEPVVDEFAVHSLEHGAVWLTYLPGAPPADVSALAELAAVQPAYVLVSPVPGQPAPYMATAWGLQMQATDPRDPRLRLFTQTYAAGGQGGEKGADCAGGSTPEQARAALSAVGR